ncbi:MAG: YchJ family metal-binding protein, partial [Alphaproteobacteria bacterium]
MTPCPCGSAKDVDDCCAPVIAGSRAALTAEDLLRARYCAFSQGNVGYLVATLAPELRAEYDQIEAESTARDADWQGLEIRTIKGGGKDDDSGEIEFVARFRLGDEPRIHHELSTFRRDDDGWLCSGGEVNPKGPPVETTKVGRNDPCPCG